MKAIGRALKQPAASLRRPAIWAQRPAMGATASYSRRRATASDGRDGQLQPATGDEPSPPDGWQLAADDSWWRATTSGDGGRQATASDDEQRLAANDVGSSGQPRAVEGQRKKKKKNRWQDREIEPQEVQKTFGSTRGRRRV